jgi:hypothetical protein
MPPTVEDVCKQLVRRRIQSAEAVQALYQRWRKQGKNVQDARQFGRWLIAEKALTMAQASQLFQPATNVSTPAAPMPPALVAPPIPEIDVELVKPPKRWLRDAAMFLLGMAVASGMAAAVWFAVR